MAMRLTIALADREFFEVIAQTAFCNPFSEQRAELDARLVGHEVEAFAETHLDELTRKVSARVQALEARGAANVRRYAGRERDLIQTVFLFELFHRFHHQFDELIQEQTRLGDQSAPVKFGEEALSQIRARGIEATEAVRFFSIFYQLRRAFHFIVRGLIGRSPCMREFRRHLWQNVFTREVRLYEKHLWNRMEDFSTLILGETGSGKGAAAAAIGRSGYIPFDERQNRFAQSFLRAFISLNLSQFPEALIESELFGHRKGAFTGAVEAHQGVLARCSSHGAIFLDEIGEVPVPVQIKLLQVLQQRTFCPVGSHETERFRGRVIAATNRPLETLREEGLFRDDFFYRLCSDIVEVPPLRKRLQEDPEELHQLIEHLVASMLGAPATEIVDEIQKSIRRKLGPLYDWPGNVRELEQAVRRILITGQYSGATGRPGSGFGTGQFASKVAAGTMNADELLAGYVALLYQKFGNYEEVARRTNLDRRTVKRYLRLEAS
jgi:DNA-binding NtrC family response regulator